MIRDAGCELLGCRDERSEVEEAFLALTRTEDAMIGAGTGRGRWSLFVEETAKLPAFARRDFLVAWSYRFAFFTDALALFLQAFLFYFVGLLVDESKLPEFGGSPVSYMEFVVIGIALAAFVADRPRPRLGGACAASR